MGHVIGKNRLMLRRKLCEKIDDRIGLSGAGVKATNDVFSEDDLICCVKRFVSSCTCLHIRCLVYWDILTRNGNEGHMEKV